MPNFFKLNILGLERNLPILPTPSGIMIAGFNPVGDTELIKVAGEFLEDKLKDFDFDILLTTELKGIPITQEIARRLNKDYVCLRKAAKCYMLNPTKTSGESITSGTSEYYVSELDLNKLVGKKVLFVDDVFSTGSTLNSMLTFAKNNKIKIVCGAFILKEAPDNKEFRELSFKYNEINIICAGFLPLQ